MFIIAGGSGYIGGYLLEYVKKMGINHTLLSHEMLDSFAYSEDNGSSGCLYEVCRKKGLI